MSKEVLSWVAFLDRCRSVEIETLRVATKGYTNLMFNLGIKDVVMSEMYMAMSYALLERLGEEETSMELQLFTPVYSGQESQERRL